MSVGLSEDYFSACTISAFGDDAYTDSTGGRCRLRLRTYHWDRSIAPSDNVPNSSFAL